MNNKQATEMYNYDLLVQLYSIFAPSGKEKKMRKFIRKYCNGLGANVESDNAGNIYVTKGVADTYPCICAHIDQVQDQHSKDFQVFRSGDIIFGYSAKSKAQQGLGADDKNGVWIALELLKQFGTIKCAFFVGEEIGCVGSSQARMDFFKDVRFVVEPDRRNAGDLITDISGRICSDDFLNDIDASDYGYKETQGLMTDVQELSQKNIGVSCINISCGYYHPHTDEECTSWSELCNARDFAAHIVAKCTEVYPHKYEKETYWKGSSLWSSKSYNDSKHWYNGYDFGAYDNKKYDEDTMADILFDEPYLEFDELMQFYSYLFTTKDTQELRQMYDELIPEIAEDYYLDDTITNQN